MAKLIFLLMGLGLLHAQPGGAAAERRVASMELNPKSESEAFQDEAASAALDTALAQLTKSGPVAESDRLARREFEGQVSRLEKAGFQALRERVKGNVFSPSRIFQLVREEPEHIHYQGRKVATTHHFRFYFTQFFVEAGKAPTPSTLLPQVRLTGHAFIRCPSKAPCEEPVFGLKHVEIEWAPLFSVRGANSSAGGAGGN